MEHKVLTFETYLNTRKFNYGKYKNMTIAEIKEAIEKEKENGSTNSSD